MCITDFISIHKYENHTWLKICILAAKPRDLVEILLTKKNVDKKFDQQVEFTENCPSGVVHFLLGFTHFHRGGKWEIFLRGNWTIHIQNNILFTQSMTLICSLANGHISKPTRTLLR